MLTDFVHDQQFLDSSSDEALSHDATGGLIPPALLAKANFLIRPNSMRKCWA